MYKPRKFNTSRRKCGESAGKKKKVKPLTNVCIPYTSERDSNRIRNYVKSKNIPVRPVFTPGTTLKQIFCNSRLLDTTSCVLSNPDRCQICPLISNGNCHRRGTVYEIICKLCTTTMRYQGEADRPLHYRISEHLRAANNPSSYPNNALAQPYMKNHYMVRAKFEVNIIDHKHNTIKRKLSEALHIHRNQPELNEKSELEHIVKYMSQ